MLQIAPVTEALIEKDWLRRAAGDVARVQPDARRVTLIYDEHTFAAIGRELRETLASAYELQEIHLGQRPVASLPQADALAQQAAGAELLIAVGSGTINDLCKYAAHRQGIPYIAVATAPSMNGYLSATASLYDGRAKRSFAASPPCALFADLAVLAHAPRPMVRAGIGDTLCRSTVQTDWLLSHLLLGTPYNAALFKPLLAMEAELIAQSRQVSDRDPMFIRLLMRMLLLSGEAMARAGSSAPASQGEHLIAHTYHLIYGESNRLHGEEIAVTTLTMARIQEKVMLKKPVIRAMTEPPARFVQLFGRQEGEALYSDYHRKAFDTDMAQAVARRIESDWADIKRQLSAVHIPHARLETALTVAGCPVQPKDIGWSGERYEHAVGHAHLTRDRFTFLDLAAMDASVRIRL